MKEPSDKNEMLKHGGVATSRRSRAPITYGSRRRKHVYTDRFDGSTVNEKVMMSPALPFARNFISARKV